MLPVVNEDLAKDLTSSAVMELWAGAKREEPSPVRKARPWAISRARVAGSALAPATSPSIKGVTYSSNSCRVNLAEVMKEESTSTKKDLEERMSVTRVRLTTTSFTRHRGGILLSRRDVPGSNLQTEDLRTAHSHDSFRWPTVSLCSIHTYMGLGRLRFRNGELTLKAKFFRACATPGLGSYLLPALIRKVTADVGWLLSMAATLNPALSTAVSKVRAMR